MKSQFNMTRGVVRVTGNDQMGLDRVFDVSGIRKGVFLVRFYNTDTEGTLYLESSNQNTDATDALWVSIGSTAISSSSSNSLVKIVGDEDELFTYLRWRFAVTSGTAGTTFEITGYGLD